MRCLFVSPFVPFPPEDGGRIRIHELMKGIARHNQVDLLTLDDGSEESRRAVGELRSQGFPVDVVSHRTRRSPSTVARALMRGDSLYRTLYTSDALARSLRARLADTPYDIVQYEFAFMAPYAPPRSGDGPRVVIDAHNLEYRLNVGLRDVSTGARGIPYRTYARREAARRRREETAMFQIADQVVTVSRADRDALRRDARGVAAEVVPNGVDLERFVPSPAPEDDRPPSAVFVGKMDYRPNVDAVRWFCAEVMPLVRRASPDFRFVICGSRPTAAVRALDRIPGVSVLGRVPDTRPYLREAALAVVPLRAGSGTRLKVLEALALGRPVVSTTLGCEGLDVVDGRHVVLADSAAGFADRVVGLLARPTERERLARAGRRLAEDCYGWPAIVNRLEQIYERVRDRERSSSTTS